jgi:cation transport regulator ChaB
MPITIADAPDTLPAAGKKLFVGAFNGAFDGECKGEGDRRDECARRIAWYAVKEKYKKSGDKWVAKAALVGVDLLVVKASLHEDGTMRWLCTASDTDADNRHDRTTIQLFRDWIRRVEDDVQTSFLPPPRMPFLGLSHYPSLDGFGEAGECDRLYIDGNQFKAGGIFFDRPLGRELFAAVREELAAIKRGDVPDLPIRISAAWWDVEHAHSDFVFRRRDLDEVCPMCLEGLSKTFLKGQLDHYAATRVPIHPRTSLALEERSMAVTRKEDAASIVSDELAEELEEKAKERMEQRSEAGDEAASPALVVKAAEAVPSGAAEADPLGTEDADEVLEAGGEGLDDGGVTEEPAMEEQAATKTVGGKKYPASDFLVVEDPKKSSTWHLQVKKNGKPDHRLMGAAWAALHKGYRGQKYAGPDKAKAIKKLKSLYKSEKMKLPTQKSMAEMFGPEILEEQMIAEVAYRPFGGATSIEDAESWMEAQDRMFQVYDSWGVFRAVMENILDDEELADKVSAIRKAISAFGDRVGAIKSEAVDAFLSRSVVVEGEASMTEKPKETEQAVQTEETPPTGSGNVDATLDPGGAFWSAVDALAADVTLSRAEMLERAQEEMNTLAQATHNRINQARPPEAGGEEMKAMVEQAVTAAVGPLAEKVALLLARQQAASAPAMPVQKSLIAPVVTQGPAAAGFDSTKPVSDIRALARRSVGLPA